MESKENGQVGESGAGNGALQSLSEVKQSMSEAK